MACPTSSLRSTPTEGPMKRSKLLPLALSLAAVSGLATSCDKPPIETNKPDTKGGSDVSADSDPERLTAERENEFANMLAPTCAGEDLIAAAVGEFQPAQNALFLPPPRRHAAPGLHGRVGPQGLQDRGSGHRADQHR